MQLAVATGMGGASPKQMREFIDRFLLDVEQEKKDPIKQAQEFGVEVEEA